MNQPSTISNRIHVIECEINVDCELMSSSEIVCQIVVVARHDYEQAID